MAGRLHIRELCELGAAYLIHDEQFRTKQEAFDWAFLGTDWALLTQADFPLVQFLPERYQLHAIHRSYDGVATYSSRAQAWERPLLVVAEILPTLVGKPYGNKIMAEVVEVGEQRLAVVGLVIDFGYTFEPPANPVGCACGSCENCRYYSAEFISGTYPVLNSPIKNFYLPFVKRLAVTDADCVRRD